MLRRGRSSRRGTSQVDGRQPVVAPAILVCALSLALALSGCDATTTSPGASRLGETAPGSTGPAATDPLETQAPAPSSDPVQIEVVETGFTVIPDDPSGSVVYAAVLRNPNTEWALQRADVLIDLLDADGAFVAGADVVVTLLPGQTGAVAGVISGGATAASLRVEPPEELTAFVPRLAGGEGFDVREISTRPTGSGWLTSGTLVSRFETTQTFVEVVAVHRDPAGAIVGGATGGVEVIEPGASVTFDVLDAAPHPSIGGTDVYWQVTR